MSERFKIYTKQEALKVVDGHLRLLIASNEVVEAPMKEIRELGLAKFNLLCLPDGAVIDVDMEAER